MNLARNTDPQTSHDAIPSAAQRADQKSAILWLLEQVGPMTDYELARHYGEHRAAHGWPATQPDSVRKRRADLKNEGRVIATGETASAPGHRTSTVWGVA